MSDISPFLLPQHWTPIAERPRDLRGRELLAWRELPGAQLSLADAVALAASGAILMANRHFPDRVELVIRPVASTAAGKSPLTAAAGQAEKTRQSTAAV